MASSLVAKRLIGSNLLTRSSVMFPQTAATTSRSYNTITRLVGSLKLSYEASVKESPDKEERKICFDVGLKAKHQQPKGDRVESIRVYDLLDYIKKQEFSYEDDSFIATLKDGLCEVIFPEVTEKHKIKKVEIKFN